MTSAPDPNAHTDKPNLNHNLSAQLRDLVCKVVERYLHLMDNNDSETGIHQLMMRDIEPVILNCVLTYTDNNRSKAARLLGMTRSTLDSKIKRYKL